MGKEGERVMEKSFVEVGVVKALYRYPVKSMRGEALDEATLSWHGLDGDRRAAFVRADNGSGFPWLTGRQVPQLLQYRPYFAASEKGAASAVRVGTPGGRDLALESDELQAELAQLYGRDVHLIKINRGVYDSQVLSLMSLATTQALGEQIDTAVNHRRFRQNVIIETFNDQPYIEETWLGSSLVFGNGKDAAQVRLNRRIKRCVMINIDPETAEKDARILKTVAQTRDSCAGVYASPETYGTIRVGDMIRRIIA